MFGFIKKLLFGDADTHRDVEVSKEAPTVAIETTPKNEWYIPQIDGINNKLVYDKTGEKSSYSLTYNEEANRLEVLIDGKTTPANITTRVFKTVNNRFKKAGVSEIAEELFNLWEAEIIQAQGKAKGTYASLRLKKTPAKMVAGKKKK